MDLSHIAGLNQKADLGAALGSHEVVVDRGTQQKRRNRRHRDVAVTIAEDNEPLSLTDQCINLAENLSQATVQGRSPAGNRIQARNAYARETGLISIGIDVQHLGQFVIVDYREGKHDLAAVRGCGLKHVSFRPNKTAQRRDDLFTDGVQRRIGDLSEQLCKVVKQHARTI